MVRCHFLLDGSAESRIVGVVGNKVLGSWRLMCSWILVELRVEQKRLHNVPCELLCNPEDFFKLCIWLSCYAIVFH